jgi:hypothetical protein
MRQGTWFTPISGRPAIGGGCSRRLGVDQYGRRQRIRLAPLLSAVMNLRAESSAVCCLRHRRTTGGKRVAGGLRCAFARSITPRPRAELPQTSRRAASASEEPGQAVTTTYGVTLCLLWGELPVRREHDLSATRCALIWMFFEAPHRSGGATRKPSDLAGPGLASGGTPLSAERLRTSVSGP